MEHSTGKMREQESAMKKLVIAAAAAAVLLGSIAPGVAKARHGTAGAHKPHGQGTFDRVPPPAPAPGPSPEQLRMDREDT